MTEISDEIVILAYNLFLGRDPENQEVIEYYKKTKSVYELSEMFINSQEFLSRIGIDFGKSNLRKPIDIEMESTPQKLDFMISRIKEVWSDYGINEPYWSVLAEEKFYKNSFNEHQEEFYSSGLDSIKLLADSLARNKIFIENFSTCLEFGCGTGRVTCHLANQFKKVIACDISFPHLQIAEKYTKNLGIDNIVFHNTLSPTDILELPKVDVIISIIVLQHNPPPLIAEYIRALLRKLNPSGVVFFQVPTYRKGYKFLEDDYLKVINENKLMEMHVIPQSHVFEIVRDHNCIVREVREDNWPGDNEFISNSFLINKL